MSVFGGTKPFISNGNRCAWFTCEGYLADWTYCL